MTDDQSPATKHTPKHVATILYWAAGAGVFAAATLHLLGFSDLALLLAFSAAADIAFAVALTRRTDDSTPDTDLPTGP
jgi:hypothetical protein